jgi:hypothetical protein
MQKSNAVRRRPTPTLLRKRSSLRNLLAIAALVAASSYSAMAGDDAKTTQITEAQKTCVSVATTAYLTANAELVSRGAGIMSVDDTIAQRRLVERYCKQFAGCMVSNLNPNFSDMAYRAMFASCLDDEAQQK